MWHSTSFHGVNERRHGVVQKRVRRSKLGETSAQLPACVMGMEACGSVQMGGRRCGRKEIDEIESVPTDGLG